MGLAGADGGGGEFSLLADVSGDISRAAGYILDGGQILELADEVERAQRFPNFAHAGIDAQDRLAFGYRGLIGDKPLADDAGNLRAQLACRAIAVFDSCEQCARIYRISRV